MGDQNPIGRKGGGGERKEGFWRDGFHGGLDF